MHLTISGLHCFALLCSMIGQGSMCYVLNQSDAKLKLIVAWSLFLSYTISFVRIFLKFSFRELIPIVSNIL